MDLDEQNSAILSNRSEATPLIEEHPFRQAEDALRSSWQQTCFCGKWTDSKSMAAMDFQLTPGVANQRPPARVPSLSLGEAADHWNARLPWEVIDGPRPLHQAKILPRDNTSNDYESIPWETLLAGNGDPPAIDLAKSEAQFLQRASLPDLTVRRSWDVGSFIARVTSLAVHNRGFRLSYRPSFLQRITQNPRVRIADIEPHKVKHLRLGQGVAEGGYRYSTYPTVKRQPRVAEE